MAVFPLRPFAIFITRCLSIAITVLVASTDIRASTLDIDRHPALTIGRYQISRYLVDKFYRRHADEIATKRSASSAKHDGWFEDFLSKQVVIAYLAESGYFERPEIQNAVLRMECHMLSSSSGLFPGPVYRQLFEGHPMTDADYRAMMDHIGTRADLIVARFNTDDSAASHLGPDFKAGTLQTQTRQIFESHRTGGIELVDGQFPWPFFPFFEIAEPIVNVVPGRWVELRQAGFGLYYIFVRSLAFPSNQGPSVDGEAMRRRFQELHRETLARRRRVSHLVMSQFVLDETVARSMAETLSTLPEGTPTLPENAFPLLYSQILFHYKEGAENLAVSVRDYCQYFNNLFVRQLPRSLDQLRRSAEGMIVQRLDVLESKEKHLDQTPQFAEDRHGYTGFQALEVYERDVLIPTINISDKDVEQYYRVHSADFVTTSMVCGNLVTFDSLSKASAWIQHQHLPETTDLPIAISSEEIYVSAEQPIAGAERLQPLIMMSGPGASFGPFTHNSLYAVFVKKRDTETSSIPVASASASIRSTLMRQALDERERQLANDLSRRGNIIDRIDYTGYRIDPDSLNLPWRRAHEQELTRHRE